MAIDDMDIPGFRLPPLKGEMRGHWSIIVNGKSWLAMQGAHDLWIARQHVNLTQVGKLAFA